MELELFPLFENKNLATHRLLQPFSTKRDISHDFHRRFIGTEQWRIKKSNIQTIAGRSFKLSQVKFEKELAKVVHYLQYNYYTALEAKKISKKIFYEYYKKAYFLGVKAAGAGISQSYLQLMFKDSADPSITQEETRWIRTAVAAERKFWGKFLNNVSQQKAFKLSMSKRIKMYASSLEGTYNAGRVAGSPTNSLVYWLMDKKTHVSCPECDFLADKSPWTKEILPTTPKSGLCSCLSNCRCALKIIPTTAEDYKRHKGNLSSSQILSRIKRLSL